MSYQTKILLPFFGMLGLAVMVTVAVARMASADQATQVQPGDLSSAALVEIRETSGTAVVTGAFERKTESDGEVQLVAALHAPGATAVSGEVEIEIPPAAKTDQRQEFEVEIEGLRPQTSYSVFVDDRLVISLTTDARGRADIEVKASR